MNARLPAENEGATIRGMKIGAQAYTVPWAMWADRKRELWLHPTYTVQDRPGGTVQMQLIRTSEGFVADIRHCREHTWLPEDRPGYVGADESTAWLPVIELRH